MTIRKAVPEDAEMIAPYILLAMEDIVYDFIGERNYNHAIAFMCYFIKSKKNQYSYENCWVAETDQDIVAAVLIYDGAQLEELRAPVIEYVRTHYQRDLSLENETQAGEYYIDSLGVSSLHQGKGIGSQLLGFLIQEYVYKEQHALGLLVDADNSNARKLYLKLGFKKVGEKNIFGKKMEHLQRSDSMML